MANTLNNVLHSVQMGAFEMIEDFVLIKAALIAKPSVETARNASQIHSISTESAHVFIPMSYKMENASPDVLMDVPTVMKKVVVYAQTTISSTPT